MSLDFQLEVNDWVRHQHCPLCKARTWQRAARIGVYDNGTLVGIVCPDCLQLPRFAEFRAALEACVDAEADYLARECGIDVDRLNQARAEF